MRQGKPNLNFLICAIQINCVRQIIYHIKIFFVCKLHLQLKLLFSLIWLGQLNFFISSIQPVLHLHASCQALQKCILCAAANLISKALLIIKKIKQQGRDSRIQDNFINLLMESNTFWSKLTSPKLLFLSHLMNVKVHLLIIINRLL